MEQLLINYSSGINIVFYQSNVADRTDSHVDTLKSRPTFQSGLRYDLKSCHDRDTPSEFHGHKQVLIFVEIVLYMTGGSSKKKGSER